MPKKSYLFHFFGYYGVEIFFVLSGFLIGNILIRHFINEPAFGFKTISNFWGRRWLRTLPLYYCILLLNMFLYDYSKVQIWKFFFFLQSMKTNTFSFFGESWSLAVEEFFYLSFPLLLWGMEALFKRAANKQKVLITTIVTYICFFTVLRVAGTIFYNPQWNLGIRPVVLFRLDAIAYGVLGAYIFNFYKPFWEKHKQKLFWIGLFLIAACTLYFEAKIAANYYYKRGDTPFFAKTFYFSIVSIAFLFIIPYTAAIQIRNKFLAWPITYISKVSYSIYLINLYFVPGLNKYMPDDTWLQALSILVVFIVINLAVAYIPYYFIEQSFLKLRDRYFKEKYKAA